MDGVKQRETSGPAKSLLYMQLISIVLDVGRPVVSPSIYHQMASSL
jgi:hypothetical protein